MSCGKLRSKGSSIPTTSRKRRSFVPARAAATALLQNWEAAGEHSGERSPRLVNSGDCNALLAEPSSRGKWLTRTHIKSFWFGTVPPSFQRKDRIVFAREQNQIELKMVSIEVKERVTFDFLNKGPFPLWGKGRQNPTCSLCCCCSEAQLVLGLPWVWSSLAWQLGSHFTERFQYKNCTYCDCLFVFYPPNTCLRFHVFFKTKVD